MAESSGILERAVGIVKSLSLTNVLILALIILIAAPAYFAYKFMIDDDFRHEFMSRALILEKHVPCIVLEGSRYAAQTRHTVLVVYAVLDDRREKLIGIRSPSPMTDQQITDTCKQVLQLSDEIQDTIRDKERSNAPAR
jgi:hypothetical protein